MTAQPWTVMLVDDHAVVREGFTRWLEYSEEFRVVADASNGKDAYALLRETSVDLMVTDVSMPGMSGLETVLRVKVRYPETKIIVYSMHHHVALVRQLLSAGAHGFVSKSSPPQELLEAMRKVCAGETAVSSDILTLLTDSIDDVAARLGSLSAREFEIFQALIQGQSLESIASGLNISYKTAANTQTTIRQKLSVNNDIELVRLALQAGLIS